MNERIQELANSVGMTIDQELKIFSSGVGTGRSIVMNERIKQLAIQARLRSPLILQHWGKIEALTDSEQEELENIEKFAELLIKECISQIALIGVSNFENEDVLWTVETAISSIERRLGVEE